MSMFTLAISCLTTSNLPWFMDLTFQVPMQYCSLQHQTLLLSPVTSTTGYCHDDAQSVGGCNDAQCTGGCEDAQSVVERSYTTSEVREASRKELSCVRGQGQWPRVPGCDRAGASKRSYPHPRSGVAAERSDPRSKEQWLSRRWGA